MWKPVLPTVPKPLADFLQQIVDRINGIEPKEGLTTVVTDSAGGGKNIEARQQGSSELLLDTYVMVNGVRRITNIRIQGGLRVEAP